MSRFLVPLFFIIAALGVFIVLTQPKMDVVNAARADVAIYNEALSNGQKLVDVRKKLLDKYNAFPVEDAERLKKILPDSIDNVRLIIDLDTIAAKYGMELKNVRILTSPGRANRDTLGPDGQKFGSVGMSFGVSGSYEVFRRFVTDIEKSLRIMDIVAVSFTSSDRDVSDFTVEIRTYWLK